MPGLGGGTEEGVTSGSVHQEERAVPGRPDQVAIDIGSISLLPSTSSNNDNSELGSSHSQQVPPPELTPKLQKALSRKGSQRVERKKTDASDSHGGDNHQLHVSGGIQAGHNRSLIVVTSSIADGSARTPEATTCPVRRKRPPSPPWLHPRGVLLFFATLSSVGTLLLLYFTLRKMGGGDRNAQ